MASQHRAGRVALVGKPNVGKSTLLNLVVGQTVSIVSDKPQTTRRRVVGIATEPDYQIVFVDSPGLHKARTKLGRLLNEAARRAIQDVDVVVAVVDASKPPDAEDRAIADLLRSGGWVGSGKLLVCLNKVDLLRPIDVVAHVEGYSALFGTEDSMLTSLSRGDNLDKLVTMIVERLPEQEPLYGAGEVTDQPMSLLAADLIREKVLRLTRREVPHAVAVRVDEWTENEDRRVVVARATILVERDSQKAILIGKGGQMLKRIGTEARQEVEAMTGWKLFLELFVKVSTDWRQNPRALSEMPDVES